MALADLREGHEGVELLCRSLQRGRLGHAYLFTGDQAGLLESVAGNLAKALNCVDAGGAIGAADGHDSCDRCSVCRRIDARQHPDVLWVRPESKSRVIVIDQIRDVLQVMSLKPSEARTKVAVIVDADRMNAQAANAFLKTLEEPPGRATLILLSPRPQSLLPTILSRCLCLRFGGGGPVLPVAVEDWLGEFARELVTPQKGLLGRYQLLGRWLDELGEVRTRIEGELKERSPMRQYDEAEPKLREKWEDEFKAALESEYRRQRTEYLTGLQWFFRDVWFQVLDMDEELLAVPSVRESSNRLARRSTAELTGENLRVLNRAERLLETNLQESLVLEVALLRLRL